MHTIVNSKTQYIVSVFELFFLQTQDIGGFCAKYSKFAHISTRLFVYYFVDCEKRKKLTTRYSGQIHYILWLTTKYHSYFSICECAEISDSAELGSGNMLSCRLQHKMHFSLAHTLAGTVNKVA